MSQSPSESAVRFLRDALYLPLNLAVVPTWLKLRLVGPIVWADRPLRRYLASQR